MSKVDSYPGSSYDTHWGTSGTDRSARTNAGFTPPPQGQPQFNGPLSGLAGFGPGAGRPSIMSRVGAALVVLTAGMRDAVRTFNSPPMQTGWASPYPNPHMPAPNGQPYSQSYHQTTNPSWQQPKNPLGNVAIGVMAAAMGLAIGGPFGLLAAAAFAVEGKVMQHGLNTMNNEMQHWAQSAHQQAAANQPGAPRPGPYGKGPGSYSSAQSGNPFTNPYAHGLPYTPPGDAASMFSNLFGPTGPFATASAAGPAPGWPPHGTHAPGGQSTTGSTYRSAASYGTAASDAPDEPYVVRVPPGVVDEDHVADGETVDAEIVDDWRPAETAAGKDEHIVDAEIVDAEKTATTASHTEPATKASSSTAERVRPPKVDSESASSTQATDSTGAATAAPSGGAEVAIAWHSILGVPHDAPRMAVQVRYAAAQRDLAMRMLSDDAEVRANAKKRWVTVESAYKTAMQHFKERDAKRDAVAGMRV